MKKENWFARFKEWSGLNAETAQDRLEVALAWAFCIFFGSIILFFAILLWKVTVFLLAVLVIIAVVTSPVWIWIIKGKK